MDFCPTCVTFMENTLTELVNIIANIGVITGCVQLCSYLSSPLQVDVCDALCSTGGVAAFVKFIEGMETNPDPIYLCEELTACTGRDTSQARFTQFVIMPNEVKQGAQLNISVSYQVLNRTGTGQLNIYVTPPGTTTQTEVSSMFIENLSIGKYATYTLISTDTSSKWPVGAYTANAALCEGTCGSTYPLCKTLDTDKATFSLQLE